MTAREISIAFQTDKTPSTYIALAKLVNQYGFDVVSVYCDAPFHPSYGPLMLMAPHIQRARIGTAAVSPSRIHPIDIAANTALLAQIANAGVYIGLSRGAWLDDYGIKELVPPLAAMREAIAVVRYMLQADTGGYPGRIFSLAEHVQSPYPLPDQMPPIMIGTWGAKMGALAGEVADEVKIGGSANSLIVPVMRDYIAEGEMAAGRAAGSVAVVIGAVTVVDVDREQARAAARRSVALYLPVVAPLDPTIEVEPDLIQRLQTLSNSGNLNTAASLISDDLLDKFAFAGNAHDLIEQGLRLFEAGVNRIEFGTPHGLNAERGIRLLGEKVIPALRQSIT